MAVSALLDKDDATAYIGSISVFKTMTIVSPHGSAEVKPYIIGPGSLHPAEYKVNFSIFPLWSSPKNLAIASSPVIRAPSYIPYVTSINMRCLRHNMLFLGLVLILATASNARPGTRHVDNGLLYGRSGHHITTSDHQLGSLKNLVWPTAKAPSKRMMPGFRPIANRLPMTMIQFRSVRALIPIQTASEFLMEFYAYVAHMAATAWAQTPRRPYFYIQEGNFILSFNAVGDTVPWDTVQELAERLWDCAARGLTDLFDAYYAHENTNIALQVSLRIIDECLSSSDSDFCYREGSVETVTGPDWSNQIQPWGGT